MRKDYSQWVKLSVATSLLVIGVFYIWLKQEKQQPTPISSPSPGVSITPTTTTGTTPASVASPSASPNSPVNHKERAEAAYKAKDYTTAISEYNLAIEQTTNKEELALLWNSLGNAYRDNQNLNEAIKAYDKALSYNARYGEAYLNKAAVLWGQEKKEEAKTTLRTGIDKDATRKQDLQNTLDVYEAMSR